MAFNDTSGPPQVPQGPPAGYSGTPVCFTGFPQFDSVSPSVPSLSKEGVHKFDFGLTLGLNLESLCVMCMLLCFLFFFYFEMLYIQGIFFFSQRQWEGARAYPEGW